MKKKAQEYEINRTFNDAIRTFMDEGWSICSDIGNFILDSGSLNKGLGLWYTIDNPKWVDVFFRGDSVVCFERDGEYIVLAVIYGTYQDWEEDARGKYKEELYAVVALPVIQVEHGSRGLNIEEIDYDNATIIQQFNMPRGYRWNTDWRTSSRRPKNAMKKRAWLSPADQELYDNLKEAIKLIERGDAESAIANIRWVMWYLNNR